MDEQCFSWLEPRAFVEREPGEMKRHEDSGGFGFGHFARHFERHGGGSDDVLGVAAEGTRRNRHDPPPEPRLGAVSALFDDPEHFHSRDVRNGPRYRLVPAVDPVQIVEVQRHRRDADLQLPGPGSRRVDIVELQDLRRRAVAMHSPGLHDSVLHPRFVRPPRERSNVVVRRPRVEARFRVRPAG